MTAEATARPAPGDVAEVVIERVGSRGDGVAHLGPTPVFVPFALPGDRLRVRLQKSRGDGYAAQILDRLEQGAARAEPPCPHFGHCGGCQLQHLPRGTYGEWLRGQVIEVLAHRGLRDIEVTAPVITPPGTRRRVRLAFARRGEDVHLGFRERAGHRITDITVCPIAVPVIERLIPDLRGLLRHLPMARRRGEVQVTAADSGLDVVLIAREAPQLADREALAAFAERHDLARVSWRAATGAMPEPVVARRPVQVRFAGVAVDLPPGAFLQAMVPAEDAMRAAVESALGDAQHVADLYAGCGTFALPLAAAGRQVRAIEVDHAMLDALERAARRAGLTQRIATQARDLERRPLGLEELRRLDAVVLDPLRAGARAQADALARSAVPGIAMVSCHPSTFARDARALVDGGYRLLRVQPIDPFLWSAEIELVGSFVRTRS
jgi:23S rRNA (uracil1939-C5)-methyltransferase